MSAMTKQQIEAVFKKFEALTNSVESLVSHLNDIMSTKTVEVPPMTHPYGAHWEQPARESIVIDDTHALMSQATFMKLHEYSCTNPTGVYEGKMWKRHNGLFDPRCKPEDRHWMLCWFGFSDDPDKCSNNSRRILIA